MTDTTKLYIPGRKRTRGIPVRRRYLRKGDCLQCGWCCIQEGCTELVFDGEKYRCGRYHSPDRPEKCKNFPQAPPILNPDCGYYFLDRWENDRVVKFGRDL